MPGGSLELTVKAVPGETDVTGLSHTGSATAGGMAAALMLATSRLLARTGRPEFGRGALAGVERGFRAKRVHELRGRDARTGMDGSESPRRRDLSRRGLRRSLLLSQKRAVGGDRCS